MFDTILIANRGEIACRIIRTCKRLGIRSIAVYGDADAQAQHVLQADAAAHIGASPPRESYLRIDAVIDAARKHGAQAIHPGYGFLSENEEFARACAAAGLAFIGPSAQAIEQMGSKSAAKRLMERAGVPVVPGYHGEAQDSATLTREVQRIGFPLLIKAVAGGGGKGMRLVQGLAEFDAQLDAARREARNAFGDDAVLLERYVQDPHHIEFQVFGDTHGNVVHLFERECSIQRRHQKVLEETPSPFLDDALRERMAQAAVAAAKAIDYVNAGTIEFIVGGDRAFYFMEMNTRLQVEHPITEMTTGLDLVEWQLRVAGGEPLPLTQAQIRRRGHAIEVRVCAENPRNDFLPATGRLLRCAFPVERSEIRVDTGVTAGDDISIYYDSMIAKLVAFGSDRVSAIAHLRDALQRSCVIGPATNLELLQRIAANAEFAKGRTDTRFIEAQRADLFPAAGAPLPALAAAALVLHHAQQQAAPRGESPWQSASGWRLNAPAQHDYHLHDVAANKDHSLRMLRGGGRTQTAVRVGADTVTLKAIDIRSEQLSFALNDATYVFHYAYVDNQLELVTAEHRYALEEISLEAEFAHSEVAGGRLTAMMPGRIIKVLVSAGAAVTQNQPLLIMEAMKMEHTIRAPRDGVVARVLYKADDIVAADALLFEFAET